MSGQGATEQLKADPAADTRAAQPETDWSPSRERTALGEAVRRMLDVVVQTGASPAELRAAAISADGHVTVDADAIFLTLSTENLQSVFARDRPPAGYTAEG
jgi:hypothetical protein